jgi:YVTN family beta-propeller protein
MFLSIERPILSAKRKIASLIITASLTAATLQACSGGNATSLSTDTPAAAAVTATATSSGRTSLNQSIKSITIPTPSVGVPDAAFSSFESAHVHPLDITPDGTKLLAVNTPNNDLEVFSISGESLTLASVIKVGLEPVSVRVFSNTQAWVVNKISNSVSVVDIKNNALIATLQTGAEPADVVFTGTAGSTTSPARAYVSVAQARELEVFDPLLLNGVTLQRIPILGQQPRALAVGPNGSGGSNVYVGIFESGNGTTAMTGGKDDPPYEVDLARSTSGPYGGISPFPDNVNATLNKYTSLYAPVTAVTPNVLTSYFTQTPPPVSVIVRRQAPANAGALPKWLDENGKDWSIFINGSLARQGTNADRVPDWDLIDRDIAVVNTTNNAVTYQGGVLNMVMALAVNPATNSVTAVGTDATNQIRYQPMLDGTFIQVLMGTYALGGTTGTKADLNPHLLPYSSVTGTYSNSSIPATCATGSSLCAANSIGDPRGIAWNAATGKGYVTAMGSNSVIVINSTGGRDSVLSTPIPVGQGPTGIVLNAVGANASSPSLAYVLNRFDANISVLSLAATSPSTAEVARVALSYDPTPQDVRNGRPLLYNTQLFSGLGQISCGSCHVDARTDRLAWDLGDPTSAAEVINGGGNGVTLRDNSQANDPITTVASVSEHPMKGPFLTMTLVDRMQSPFLHWRGDRANLAAFSPAFVELQGGAAQPTAAQINAMQAFLATLRTPPNPFRTITNAYPTEIAVPGPRNVPYRTGNAVAGAAEFEANCRACHPGNTNRGFLFVNNPQFGINQLRNPPTWQNFYRRDGLWFSDATASTAGFGFQPDGTFDSTQNLSRDDNMMSFMYSFNGSYPYTPTGLNATNTAVDSHAAVGRQVTISGATTTDPMLAQLQALADTNAVDLVASGCVSNETRGYVYVGNGNYADDRGQVHSLAAMKAFGQAGSPITFTAVRRGTGYVLGIDQNDDQTLDGAAGATSTRVCTSGTQPNLLINGSFETNSVSAGNWSNVTSLSGWKGSNGYVQVWDGLYGYSAADGNSWIQIGAGGSLDTVSQTVTTTAGDSLVLSFWYSARPGYSVAQNKFNVQWNGTVIDTLSPSSTPSGSQYETNLNVPVWQQATYIVKATGNDTLSFAQATSDSSGVGALLDAVSLVDRSTSSATFTSPMINLAYGKSASAAEIGYGTTAAEAVDGNIDGNYWDGSVAVTAGTNAQDYWEVDLGAVGTIQIVNLFNRTDCCATRLNNFYVLVSQTSMDGQSLAQLLANPAVTQVYTANTGYVMGNSPQLYSVNVGSVQGRYVRVQLAGTNQLALAEVEVMGWPAGAK